MINSNDSSTDNSSNWNDEENQFFSDDYPYNYGYNDEDYSAYDEDDYFY